MNIYLVSIILISQGFCGCEVGRPDCVHCHICVVYITQCTLNVYVCIELSYAHIEYVMLCVLCTCIYLQARSELKQCDNNNMEGPHRMCSNL